MSITQVVRGTTVLFTATFTDAEGNVTVPSGARVHVSYLNRGVANDVTIEMTPSGNSFFAEWVASDPDAGAAFWHIATEDPFPSATDGKLLIKANEANPQP